MLSNDQFVTVRVQYEGLLAEARERPRGCAPAWTICADAFPKMGA
jgi:hypothetical protein